MSQRGSFVTEYMYCNKCFQAAKSVLLARDKGLCSVVVPHWNPEHEGPEMPIIAGKIGHVWSETYLMEHDIGPELAPLICHPVRIAVLEETRTGLDGVATTITIHPERAKASP
jgi:hypothetical protein